MTHRSFSLVLAGSAAIALFLPSTNLVAQATPQSLSAQASHRQSLEQLPAENRLAQSDPAPTSDPISSISIGAVEVLELGAEPRQLIRIEPTPNIQQQAVMTMDMSGQVTAGGQTQSLPTLPITTMTMTTDVTGEDDAGNYSVDFEYTSVDVSSTSNLPPEAVESMRSQLNQLVGLSGSWMQTPLGEVSGFTMAIPEDMSPLMAQSLQQAVGGMQQMSVPFPADAIGIGARWQSPYSATVSGITMDGTATYELTGYDGNTIYLDATVEQQGTTDTLAGLPPGQTSDILINVSGQGSTAIALDRVMPIQSDMTITSATRLTMSEQGQDIPLSMEFVVNMTLAE